MTRKPCYRIDRCAGGYLVALIGRGTMRESPTFRDFVAQCLEKQCWVVADLTDCDLLDSTFLGCLIGLHKQGLQYSDTHFRLLADESCRQRLLCTSGLHQLFGYASEQPATSGDSLTLEFGHFDTRTLGQHVMNSHRLLAELGGEDAARFRSIAERLQRELRVTSNRPGVSEEL